MLRIEHKQLSLYSILYDKIPKKHILKLVKSVVDFSFINKLLESSYCKYYGRPAKEPEMMAKLLVLQFLYHLSDERIIEEASLNLAYMWFLGINPEDDLPEPSLLAKFRRQRLKEITVDDIIKEVVRQCVEKGIIKGIGISIDSTHTEANTGKLVPERIMKHLAKKILKNLEEEKGAIPDEIDKNIPDYKQIEDPQKAKETMKNYLEKLIEDTGATVEPSETPKAQKEIERAKAILNDPKFIQQKGIRSLVDMDARVGYKTKTDSFFGYKVEFAMISKERIITAVDVHDGAYVDGTEFEKLYRLTRESGILIEDVFGDKAYFRKHIIDILEEEKVNIYIPVSETVYKIDESKYSYNKDSDQWFCEMGNSTVKKKNYTRKKAGKECHLYRYYFEKEICKNCAKKKECEKSKRTAKILEVSVNTPEFYGYSKREKTEEFKLAYKKRACHEGKNGEIKRFHGLDRARGYGLKSMQMQAKLTVLAVNLKRIASLVSSCFDKKYCVMEVKLFFMGNYLKYLLKTA